MNLRNELFYIVNWHTVEKIETLKISKRRTWGHQNQRSHLKCSTLINYFRAEFLKVGYSIKPFTDKCLFGRCQGRACLWAYLRQCA